ncbi:MAG: hypothetical protein HC911_03910 [Chloroflexaceae bacterium]|nr:hypothetical protein [Chloroflexaceae bacterium]
MRQPSVIWMVLWLWGSLVLLGASVPRPAASAQRVPTIQAARATPTAAPFVPLQLDLTLAGYTGEAQVLFIQRGMHTRQYVPATFVDGRAAVTLLPRGWPGLYWALIYIDGELVAVRPNVFELRPSTRITTGAADLDQLFPLARDFMGGALLAYNPDGIPVRGYRSPDNPLLWLRDHVYQGTGFRYLEADMTSALDGFARAQRADGSFPDVLAMPERQIAAHRLDPESDLEFLFIQGVYEAWQATGDDRWMAAKLPALRRALAYITSDPLRWDAQRGLVRRPYTIDMWDFQIGPTTLSPDGQPAPRHWLDGQTIWGVFHGDNTGLAYALRLLARMEQAQGDPAQAEQYVQQSRELMQRLYDVSWNGDFFTHYVPTTATLTVAGVDPNRQLSLSNAYALNREVLDERRARAIIGSYFARRDFERAFAEWYSIDPPFPTGIIGMGGKKGENPGEYVNGGIMPLVGGELARGAFTYGDAPYGFDHLRRYAQLIELTNASYLWYYPDGRAGISSPDTLATDGWGASAMIGALIEGAAGIKDRGKLYQQVEISPRWSATPDITRTEVVAHYPASDRYVAYQWSMEHDPEAKRGQLRLDVTGTWNRARLRLLLPPRAPKAEAAYTVLLDGQPQASAIRKIGGSRYIVVEASDGDAVVTVQWGQVQ